MIDLKVSKSDWATTQTYWNDLQVKFTDPTDIKKVNFINNVLFAPTVNKEKQKNEIDTINNSNIFKLAY